MPEVGGRGRGETNESALGLKCSGYVEVDGPAGLDVVIVAPSRFVVMMIFEGDGGSFTSVVLNGAHFRTGGFGNYTWQMAQVMLWLYLDRPIYSPSVTFESSWGTRCWYARDP